MWLICSSNAVHLWSTLILTIERCIFGYDIYTFTGEMMQEQRLWNEDSTIHGRIQFPSLALHVCAHDSHDCHGTLSLQKLGILTSAVWLQGRGRHGEVAKYWQPLTAFGCQHLLGIYEQLLVQNVGNEPVLSNCTWIHTLKDTAKTDWNSQSRKVWLYILIYIAGLPKAW